MSQLLAALGYDVLTGGWRRDERYHRRLSPGRPISLVGLTVHTHVSMVAESVAAASDCEPRSLKQSVQSYIAVVKAGIRCV